MIFYCTFWAWKDPAPLDEIETRINQLLTRGASTIALCWADAPDGHLLDSYCLVISDEKITAQEASTRWQEWFDKLPDQPYH